MATFITDSISERISNRRKQKGFLVVEMADYLCERWNVSMSNAISYIREIENSLFTRLDNIKSSNLVEMHGKRISDYLASLGINEKEAESIFRDIKKIRADFNPVHSDIKPYKKV